MHAAAQFMPAGCRTFSARPILSSDEPQADKHKLERYLHDGRQASCRICHVAAAAENLPGCGKLCFRSMN